MTFDPHQAMELSVRCLEVCINDVVSSDVSFVSALQVADYFNVIAQPHPDKYVEGTLGIAM